MSVGRQWPREAITYEDPRTGRVVRQLTRYRGHSYHLYFTNMGWHDQDRRLLFGSDRENRANLFSIELESGVITQLTDLQPRLHEVSLQSTAVNPCRPETYFWYEGKLYAVDLNTLELRPLYERPSGVVGGNINVTADGRFICCPLRQDLSDRIRTDLGRGYVGFAETWEARPHCRIIRVPVDGGPADVVHAEDYWIGHVNTSPTQPHLLTFCHEGPWNRVDHRIWGLDLRDGRVWRIRPQMEGERVGHEHWIADGIRIGYHGADAGGRPFYGAIRYDNEEHVEAEFPGGSSHFHSNGLDLIVGDGSSRDPWLFLWRFQDGRVEGPRLLANHRGSFHTQITHVHPRFTPDARQVLYTSDASGYGNLCLVDVGNYADLQAR